MIIFDKISDITPWVDAQQRAGSSIGFVPTMGALHEGHTSLVNRSVSENNYTVVSIFVNPIQFNNPEDLKKYPRDLESDLKMLNEAGVDVVFTPSVEEMYPEPVKVNYDLGEIATVMEGAFRPGHFNGVAVVVHKLFQIVKPQRSYFGEKDYQQLQIIRKIVRDYNIPVEIIGCPISRDIDGLARSSRNARLSDEMRNVAPFIYAQLIKAKQLATQLTGDELVSLINETFSNHDQLKLEYFVVADGDNLKPVHGPLKSNTYGFIAVYAGDIRLIDNIRLI